MLHVALHYRPKHSVFESVMSYVHVSDVGNFGHVLCTA
jgi:hypothetical protein